MLIFASLKIPEWMDDKELRLESLRGMELEEFNEEYEEISDSYLMGESKIEDGDEVDEVDGRMIDLPFNLFDSD